MLTKITLEVARRESQQERPCASSTKQQALSADSATFSNVHVYFFFVAMHSQSPSLPFDSVQACLHGREWPTGEYVVLHIFKYAVSVKG